MHKLLHLLHYLLRQIGLASFLFYLENVGNT